MSPAGHTFRQRCRMNPSLISCCTIDWYDEWSEEAMLVVANVYLPRTLFTLESTKSPDVRDRKSTRLNSSHQIISYAVFCLKKKKKHYIIIH